MIICDRCGDRSAGVKEYSFFHPTKPNSIRHFCLHCYNVVTDKRNELLSESIHYGGTAVALSLPEKPVGAGWIVGTILALFLAVLGAVFWVAWLCAHMHIGFH